MNFARLDIHLFTTILATGLGIIVLLYILKIRRRRVVVPHLALWRFAENRREARTLWQYLRRIFSLLLQAAFVTLLAFAIADPQRAIDPVDARAHVIVIDGTATMRTRFSGITETRFDRARSLATALVHRKPSTEEVMVVVAGAHPAPLAPFSRDPTTVLDSLARARPADVHASLDDALQRAADFLLTRPSPRITVITDFVTPGLEKRWRTTFPAAVAFEAHGVGERARNVGITSLSARRSLADPRTYEIFVSVRNFNDRETLADLSLYAVTDKRCDARADCAGAGDCVLEARLCGVVQETTRIHLKPRERSVRTFSGESSAAGRFVATVGAPGPGSTAVSTTPPPLPEIIDDFATDNVAFATLPPRRRTRILHVTNGNLYLKGLFALAPEQFDAIEITPERFKGSGDSLPPHDVAIYEDVAPPTRSRVPFIAFAPRGDAGGFSSGPEVKLPLVSDVSRKHPITRWLSLKDINIASAFPLRTRPGDSVIVRGISTGGADVPLVVAREGAIPSAAAKPSGASPAPLAATDSPPRSLAVAFDARRSDLSLRVAFPLLIINAIQWFQGQSETDTVTYGTGVVRRVHVPRGGRALTVVSPSGDRTPAGVVSGVASFSVSTVGFHVLTSGDREIAVVAANLPESDDARFNPPPDVRARATIDAPTPVLARAGFDIWFILVAIALALTTLEWVTYHRRLTV